MLQIDERDKIEETEWEFGGFDLPQENWSKLPHELIMALPLIKSLAELKVVLYVLRHTWGYHETDRRISIDEFRYGRKKRRSAETGEYERIDNGTGMSENAIKDGIERAIEHGFLEIAERDETDAARIKIYYRLKMSPAPQSSQTLTPEGQKMTPRGSKVDPRTKKETLERKDTAGAIVEGAAEEKATEEKATEDIPTVYQMYENLGLLLNPTIAEQLAEAEQRYPVGWIQEAFKRAAAANVRRWNYVESILRRWEENGQIDYSERKEGAARAPTVTEVPQYQRNVKWEEL